MKGPQLFLSLSLYFLAAIRWATLSNHMLAATVLYVTVAQKQQGQVATE